MGQHLLCLLSLCAFSQLILALPPYRLDLGASLDVHDIKINVNPLYRLPKAVIPSHYELEIKPILDPTDPDNFTAPGKVTISIECVTRTNIIVLHSLDTKISLVNVTSDPAGTIIPIIGSPEPNLSDQTVTIRLGTPGLIPGRYKIYIEFVSLVSQTRVDGLYLSSYIDPDTKEKKYLCATDLEADDARRIFPLFDEPALKATWNVSIIRRANFHSLANEARLGEPVQIEPGWFKDTYREVVKMSSYLLAFAVSEFTSEVAHPSHYPGKPVTIWGPPSIMAEGGGKFSANVSAKLLAFFENYFDSEYPLLKMDKISLPDFNSGAMENWGLNTYREGRLLFIDGISTVEDKVRGTNTISHELVHQWFGNLVTMDWWNDLWLNEGFATYMAILGVDAIFPDYLAKESLLVNSIQPGMRSDILSTTHPISPDVDQIQNETHFSNMFSTITYHKGASVIRMMNAFLGDASLVAYKKYLVDYAYKTAVQDQLFDVLDNAANKNNWPTDLTVNTIMNTWTKQSGYPVVKVVRGPNTITFTQEKFGGNPTPPERWWIPITYITSETPSIDTTTKLWLGDETGVIPLVIETTQWILVNPTQIGNYRVLYDEVNHVRLLEQVTNNHAIIDPMSRSALLDDYFNLAFANYADAPLERALDLTIFLSKERHYVPWISFLTNMAHPYRMLGRTSAYLDFRRYILARVKPALDAIKMDEQPGDNPGDQILLRTRLVEWACNLGDIECVTFAKTEFATWMNTSNPTKANRINPDLRTTLYCTAMANGGDEVWDFIIARYADATDATTSKSLPDVARISLIRALGCAKQSYRLAKLLDIALDHQSFLLQEHRLTAIQAVAGNSAGVDLTFNFLRNNYDTLVRRFGTGIMQSTLSTLSNYMNTGLEKSDMEALSVSKPELSITSSILNVQKNIEWVSSHRLTLTNWLKKQL